MCLASLHPWIMCSIQTIVLVAWIILCAEFTSCSQFVPSSSSVAVQTSPLNHQQYFHCFHVTWICGHCYRMYCSSVSDAFSLCIKSIFLKIGICMNVINHYFSLCTCVFDVFHFTYFSFRSSSRIYDSSECVQPKIIFRRIINSEQWTLFCKT